MKEVGFFLDYYLLLLASSLACSFSFSFKRQSNWELPHLFIEDKGVIMFISIVFAGSILLMGGYGKTSKYVYF